MQQNIMQKSYNLQIRETFLEIYKFLYKIIEIVHLIFYRDVKFKHMKLRS